MPITIPDREFKSFEKIARAKTGFGCVVTEKIDGTNAQILIEDGKIVGVGSRNRWIKPGKEHDNYGFAGWVEQNEEELLKLGDGYHFGEWYECGIQRNYGLKEKRFALFNSGRWSNPLDRPACTECVPVLFAGEFTRENINKVMSDLALNGSRHVPGFMRPEGIVIYIPGSRSLLKETFENAEGKWQTGLQQAA